MGVGRHVQPVRIGIAQVGLDAPFEPKGIFLPCGHQQSDSPSFPGEQTVQHGSARVHSRDDLREGLLHRHLVPVSKGVVEGVHEGVAFVLRRGLRLAHHELARCVDEERIGHRAARIDCQHSRFASHAIPCSVLICLGSVAPSFYKVARHKSSRKEIGSQISQREPLQPDT